MLLGYNTILPLLSYKEICSNKDSYAHDPWLSATQAGYAHDPWLSATQATSEGKTNLSNNHVGF